MTRRHLLTLCAAAGAAHAQNPFPGTSYRDYARCLPDYLRSLAARAAAKRDQDLASLNSPAAVERRRQWVRTTFWKLVGGEPQRTPLEPQVTGSFTRSGYRVEKVVYQSRPRFHVPALLYIPTDGQPPFPAILFQMGHSLNGKADSNYQRCCQGLAKLGFLVLAFDPMGQGERVYYPDDSGNRTRLPSADDEHTVPGKQMLLVGDTATRLQLWDAVRSLDYLASHPLADPKRIGSTGQSGGATLTMLLAAVDDRLAAAVVCSGNTENFAIADFLSPGSTDDAEQDFIDAAPSAFDRWDLFYPFAPKPLLISVSDKDFFGTYSPRYIQNGWREYGRLHSIYRVLGAADRLAWTDTPLPHGLAYDSRLATYNWFRRWLQHETTPVSEEPAVAPEPDRQLYAAGGSALRAFRGETPRSLIRLPATRAAAPLESLARIDRPAAGTRATTLRRVPGRGLDIEAIEVPSVPGIWLPAWLFVPAQPDPAKPAVLVAEAAGRNGRWQEDGMYQNLARQGRLVCVADLRGIGDLAPELGSGNPRYARNHADENDYAWASLMLGKPLAGQRATDLLALAAALRAHPAARGRRLRLAASGRLATPALFAAALDPGIDELYLSGAIVSYASVLATDEYDVPLADFIPRILLHTDLPEIAASIAPRKVTLAGVLDATGDAVAPDAVRKSYASGNIEVRSQEPWNESTVSGT